MRLKGIIKIIATLMLVVAVSGCGDGNSETNGTLTFTGVTATPNAGVIAMSASAALTPIQTGSEVTFITTMFNAGGALPVPAECSGTRNTNVTGIATISCNITQPGAAATLQVSATAGGLSAVFTTPIAAAAP